MRKSNTAFSLVCSVFASALPLQIAVAKEDVTKPEMVSVLIKFVKEPGQSSTSQVHFISTSCPVCQQSNDPAFERFNARESVLYLKVPKARFLSLEFSAALPLSRRVIINDSDIEVRRTGNIVTLELPPLNEDALLAPAFETDIEEEGLVLRVEHGDIERRGGAYATGRFPSLERTAADNLTFAMREVTRRLGLGKLVHQAQIGKIMIMGFDTNFPAAHTDAPPHVHMHMRWPNNIGTQIGHYYLNESGLLTENKVGVRGLNASQRTYKRGETFTTVANTGDKVYAHTITNEGWLRIDRPNFGSCLLKPIDVGFQSGVDLDCGPLGKTNVHVTDDLKLGKITVRTNVATNHIEEIIRYDRDTGRLLSPATAPPVPPNALNPVF